MGDLGGHNLYTGTQNGSKLEVCRQGLLIHTSELKLWTLKFSHIMFV